MLPVLVNYMALGPDGSIFMVLDIFFNICWVGHFEVNTKV